MMQNVQVKQAKRLKREQILKREPILLIDIGSSKLAAMIVQFIPKLDKEADLTNFRVLASGVQQSLAVELGEVTSLLQFQRDIYRLMQNLQKQAGVKVNYAVACSSGGRPLSYSAIGEVSVENGEVSQNDIARAMKESDIPFLNESREFMHMMPINFTLDHQTGLMDPRGLLGARLAVDMHLLSIDHGSKVSVEQALMTGDIELLMWTSSAFMTGLSVLTQDEKKRGCVLVDMGAQSTSVAIFYADQLMFVNNTRLGGYHVTSDLSQAFGISLAQAEKIKTLHGGVGATAKDDRDTVDLGGEGDLDNSHRYVTRSEIIGIIRPRVEEIFEDVSRAIAKGGLDELPGMRYVLSGGAAQIPNIEDLAESYFSQRVRLGRPLKLVGATAQQESATYGGVSGLAVYLSTPKDEYWDFIDEQSGRSRLGLKSIFSWFKKNW